MCNYYLINELALGNRSLGFEFATEKEVVEMTAKTVRDSILAGKKIHGLQIAGKEDLVLDEAFFMRNYTVKTHINNIRPKYEYEGQCVANIMYIVVGSHEENGKRVYDVISSRVERTTFSEDKLKAMYDLGFISGGCKVEDGLAKDIMVNDIEELTANLKYRYGVDKIEYALWRNNCDDEQPLEEFEM